MKQMKVVDRANELMDRGLDPREAVDTLIQTAPTEEKVEWFDEVAGQYLIYQLAHERREKAGSEGSS